MARVITKKERARIITLRHAGYRICQIAREMGITKKTVYKWLKHYAKEGNVESNNTPRPVIRATTRAQDDAIIQAHRENPLRSTAEDAKQYVISTQTVRRRLREAGLRTATSSEDECLGSKAKKNPSKSKKLKSVIKMELEDVCMLRPFELVEVHYSEPESSMDTNNEEVFLI